MFSFLPLCHRRRRQILSLTTLGFFLPFSLGCTQWRPASVASEEVTPELQPEDAVKRIEPIELVGKRVRFHTDLSFTEMKVKAVTYPHVRGLVKKANTYSGSPSKNWTETEIDLRDVSAIEVLEIDGSRTAILVIAGAIVVGLFIAALASNLSSDPPPPPPPPEPSGSCPLVYVQQGDNLQLVGELYAGAIFRSMQRPDLLPLPEPQEDSLPMVVANKARETQYTDLLELVSVEHAPGTRALASNQQEVLIVGESTPPALVTDLSGRDVTTQALFEDGDLWQTDLGHYLQDENPPHKEGVVATFAARPAGGRLALELVVANTDWSQKTVERFLALTGKSFADYVDRGNLALAGPWMQLWIEREGLALAVEWRNGDAWEHVGYVSPIGPAALRRVAVPLPAWSQADAAGEVTVRVTGGTGFWQIDQIGLTQIQETPIDTRSIVPTFARNLRAEDEADLLASVDGNYQVLKEAGDELQLSFEVPKTAPNRVHSTFLSSSGYYNLHPPIGGMEAVGSYENIRDEPGGLAHFSVALYKAYYEAAVELSKGPKKVPAAE